MKIKKMKMCTLCYFHLDTRQCWALGKVPISGIRGCELAHSSLLHNILQDEEVMMLSTSAGMGGGQEPH
jgi:hypothetical protein